MVQRRASPPPSPSIGKGERVLDCRRKRFDQPAKLAGRQQQYGIVFSRVTENGVKIILAIEHCGVDAGGADARDDLVLAELRMGMRTLRGRLVDVHAFRAVESPVILGNSRAIAPGKGV